MKQFYSSFIANSQYDAIIAIFKRGMGLQTLGMTDCRIKLTERSTARLIMLTKTTTEGGRRSWMARKLNTDYIKDAFPFNYHFYAPSLTTS